MNLIENRSIAQCREKVAPRVGVFSSHLLPRSQTFVRLQAESLRGWDSWYVGLRRANPGLELPEDRSIYMNPGSLEGWAREAAFRTLGVSRAFEGMVRQLELRLIHAHFGWNGTLILPLAERLGLPLIVTFHGADASISRLRLAAKSPGQIQYLLRWKRLLDSETTFLAVSEHLAERLRRQGVPERRLVTHPIGVDVSKPPSIDPAARDRTTILMVGRLVEKKGVDILIEASAELRRRIPTLQVLVVGDGPQSERLQRLAYQRRAPCNFLGFRHRDEVASLLNSATVLAAPSRTASDGDAEGLPTVILEAQAAGLPVVATFHSGIPEAVSNHSTGLLVPESDPASLAHALETLLREAELRRRLATQAYHSVVKRFDVKAQSGRLGDIYQQATEGSVSSHGKTTS